MHFDQAYSAMWWRDRLLTALDAQTKRVNRLEKYYSDGFETLPDPPRGMTPEVFAEARAAFLNLSKMGVTNWLRMVARAPADRLDVRGFRYGDTKIAKKRGNDAWAMWQANQLDSEFALAVETIFVTGQAYGLVWPVKGDTPAMTCEHPAEMIIGYEAGSRRKRAAALKRWVAEDGRMLVTLYLPDFVYKWQTTAPSQYAGSLILPSTITSAFGAWEQRQPGDEEWPLPNPLGVVPVIEFAINTGLRARPFGGGVGEFEGVISIQERINKTVFDRLVTAEHQAFRQRYSIGWDPPTIPGTNEPDPRAAFRASQALLWTFTAGSKEDHPVQVGEFAQADFTGFIKAVEADINAMAAITQTPPHYLLGAMVNISGDAITAAESGITSKTRTHAGVLSDPVEEYVMLGLAAAGNPSAADKSSMVLWADFERRTWGEKVDGIVKLQAIGVPQDELWAMVPDVTPQDVLRWQEKAKASAVPAAPATADHLQAV